MVEFKKGDLCELRNGNLAIITEVFPALEGRAIGGENLRWFRNGEYFITLPSCYDIVEKVEKTKLILKW